MIVVSNLIRNIARIDDGKWNCQLSSYGFIIYDDVKTGLWYDCSE